MARLKLQPDPTFRAKVKVNVPGGGVDHLEFVFKYRDRDQLLDLTKEFQKEDEAADQSAPVDLAQEAKRVLKMATGWDLAEDFTAENIELLARNYPQSTQEVFFTYVRELTGNRIKN